MKFTIVALITAFIATAVAAPYGYGRCELGGKADLLDRDAEVTRGIRRYRQYPIFDRDEVMASVKWINTVACTDDAAFYCLVKLDNSLWPLLLSAPSPVVPPIPKAAIVLECNGNAIEKVTVVTERLAMNIPTQSCAEKNLEWERTHAKNWKKDPGRQMTREKAMKKEVKQKKKKNKTKDATTKKIIETELRI
ncbi:hypothetical protein K504DRAFT_452253 [Pleomassaria siparia CBS 279.74]|uniref:Uncharacterized protein n=1 Tax=Pleomassaria siparia CBS 279.74 TaxID=1314801 RepID=A0A6G1KHH0_9PLEO|nr:hypothetical protein K504DRAFT_452253 [Pleomassaria siparia CBS 279.74]